MQKVNSTNATATEVRQHFNRYVNWVELGAGRLQIVRHLRVAAVLVSAKDAQRLRDFEEAEARDLVAKQAEAEASYSKEERALIDQRIFDPKIRALMGLPPLERSRPS